MTPKLSLMEGSPGSWLVHSVRIRGCAISYFQVYTDPIQSATMQMTNPFLKNQPVLSNEWNVFSSRKQQSKKSYTHLILLIHHCAIFQVVRYSFKHRKTIYFCFLDHLQHFWKTRKESDVAPLMVQKQKLKLLHPLLQKMTR